MANEVIPNNTALTSSEAESVNFKQIIFLALRNWYWFVISCVICLTVGVLYVKRTPPTYQRNMTILVKDDRRTPTLGTEAFSGIDLFKSNSNVYNELVVIKSPALVLNVVDRLGLNYNYEAEGTFHSNVLYGTTLPVKAQLLDIADNKSASFDMDVNAESEEVTLSHFTYGGKALALDNFVQRGEAVDAQWASLSKSAFKNFSAVTALGDTLDTPVGRVVINKTSFYNPESVARTITLTKSPLHRCSMSFNSRLSAALSDKQASVIDLSYTDKNIARAEDFLNTIIAIYNENWLQDRNQVALATSIFIEDRLVAMEKELKAIDDDISRYKSDNLLPDVSATSRLYLESSKEMSNEMINLNNSLMMNEYVYKYITTSADKYQLIPAGVGLKNTSIDSQISEFNKLVLERNNLIANSSVSNPLVESMSQQILAMRENVIVSMSNNIATLKEQISQMNKIEQKNNSKIADAPSQAKYLINIERQQKTKEALYLLLLEKREENELSQAFVPYNSRVVTPPFGSPVPIAPKSRMIILMALLIGLAIPAGILYILELSDTSVHNRSDIEGRLTVPFLGEIPLYTDEKSRKHFGVSFFNKEKKSQAPIAVVAAHKRDIVNEAFRVVRTNIDFMMNTIENKQVLMTSSLAPFSGKTFIAYNLGASFAIKGQKVLVVDLDLRKLSLSQYVNKPSKGITDYLSGLVGEWKSVVVNDEKVKGLNILPGGTIPPNPTELLLQPRFQEFMKEARECYDIIILDAPPAEIVADAAIINKYVDLDLFIIRAGNVDKSALSYVQNFYDTKKFANMALILNGTDSSYHYGYAKYGYGRYGHYGYGYGYGSRKGYGYGYGNESK